MHEWFSDARDRGSIGRTQRASGRESQQRSSLLIKPIGSRLIKPIGSSPHRRDHGNRDHFVARTTAKGDCGSRRLNYWQA